MNPSANDPGEQATDHFLFQYLEGELTEEQTSAVEARLATDPALGSELELWRAAFVTPDACDTTVLEGSLLREPNPPTCSPVAHWALGLVLVAALFLSAPPLIKRSPSGKAPRAVASGKAKTIPRASPVTKSPVKPPGLVPRPLPVQPNLGATDRTVLVDALPRRRRPSPYWYEWP